METEKLTENLGLKEKHFQLKTTEIPVIDSMLYTSLGKQLFEIYRKYDIEMADQRKLESLSFLLTSFTVQPKRKPGFFKRIFSR